MKTLFNSIHKSITSKVDNNPLVIKHRASKAAALRVRLDFMGIGYRLVGELEGYKVYVNNDVILATTGVGPECPNAVVPNTLVHGKRVIIMNTAMEDSPHKDAILQHELGHIVNGHKAGPFYMLHQAFGFGSGLEVEYQADEYSFNKGEDMLGALEHLSKFTYTLAMHKRLRRMRKLVAAAA